MGIAHGNCLPNSGDPSCRSITVARGWKTMEDPFFSRGLLAADREWEDDFRASSGKNHPSEGSNRCRAVIANGERDDFRASSGKNHPLEGSSRCRPPRWCRPAHDAEFGT